MGGTHRRAFTRGGSSCVERRGRGKLADCQYLPKAASVTDTPSVCGSTVLPQTLQGNILYYSSKGINRLCEEWNRQRTDVELVAKMLHCVQSTAPHVFICSVSCEWPNVTITIVWTTQHMTVMWPTPAVNLQTHIWDIFNISKTCRIAKTKQNKKPIWHWCWHLVIFGCALPFLGT